MTTLVLVEHNQTEILKSTLATITAATMLSQPIHLLVLGTNLDAVAQHAKTISGVEKIIIVAHENLQNFMAEPAADVILNLAEPYEHIVAPSTTFGKNILPRVAALLDVMQVSDVIKIIDPKTFERPIYAGNIIETVEVLTSKKVLTIRTTAFAPQSVDNGNNTPIEEVTIAAFNGTFPEFITLSASKESRPELTSATTVVSGGRGLKNKENFQLVEDLADTLNAAVGASRAAVDAGFVANNYQVGQTGKMVAPNLYIALGISGAIQHIAGMKDSKIIVAINKDADAPIFQIATYGLVGDLFEIVPQLIKKLQG